MSKTQSTRVRKFLRSDATTLTTEAIEEIRNASKNIPNAVRIMCKRHRIGASRYKDIINNRMPPVPTDEWRSIINSVGISPSPPFEAILDEVETNISETASEVTSMISDASSVSSDKTIPSKKLSHVSRKGKAKIDNSAPPSRLLHMAEKKENRRDGSSMIVPDIEKLVNRCERLVAGR